MPCDYSKYPPNWLSEIRPRIMQRANNTCEGDNCDFKHNELVWSVKYKGKSQWFRDYEQAESMPKSFEVKKGVYIDNPKQVRVILTIAHLDHDEQNHDVKDDRLKALCQICHLRYDAKEKYNRILNKSKKINQKK